MVLGFLKNKLSGFALLLTLGAGLSSLAQDRTEIVLDPVDKPQWQRIAIPADAWGSALPDLVDMHGVTGDGSSAPLILFPSSRSNPTRDADRHKAELRNLVTRPDGGLVVDVLIPQGLVHAGLEIRLKNSTFVATAIVHSLSASMITGDLTRDVIFKTRSRGQAGTKSATVIPYWPSTAREVRLILSPPSGDAAPLELAQVMVLSGKGVPAPALESVKVPLTRLTGSDKNSKRDVWQMTLPEPGLPITMLRWFPPDSNPVSSDLAVYEDHWVDGRIEPFLLGRGTWQGSGGDGFFNLRLDKSPTGRSLFLVVRPGLAISSENLSVYRSGMDALVYRTEEDGLSLRFGGGKAVRRASWGGILERWGTTPVMDYTGSLTVKNISGVPPRETLAGIPAQSTLPEVQQFRQRFAISAQGGPGGWRILELNAQVQAASRGDLGDVRLATETGAGIPFVLVKGRQVVTQELTLDQGEVKKGYQLVDIPLDFKEAQVAAFALEVEGGPYVRKVEVFGVNKKGTERSLWKGDFSAREDESHRFVMVPNGAYYGRWNADGLSGEGPFAEMVEARGIEMDSLLRIKILLGENPPLKLTRMEAILPQHQVWYPEKTSAAWLYTGSSQLTAPSFDLKLARAPWADGAPQEATLGLQESNPENNDLEGFLVGNKMWMGLLILLLLGVAGFLAFRAMKR